MLKEKEKETLNPLKIKTATQISIIILSILGLLAGIAVFLFPQIRLMIIGLIGKVIGRNIVLIQGWLNTLKMYALGLIFLILLFDYFALTKKGRKLVEDVKREIKESFSEIDFHSLYKPVLFMSGVYFLGTFTIIRANSLYLDDIGRAIEGYRGWYNWSRYVAELLSVFIHADAKLTDISPLPQLLAIFLLSISSVLLVYILGEKKITYVRLLASIPLGLSPYFLECLSYKFDAPYMALSILTSIIPFLFISRKKTFLSSSIFSLLIMCMTYQAASGIYMLIVAILCFQDWNKQTKSYKEIFSFLGLAALAFCITMLIFKFFFARSTDLDGFYVSTAIHSLPHMIPGIWANLIHYTIIIGSDFGVIWKTGIILICILFIFKSIRTSVHHRIHSVAISILFIGLSFILSYGVYYLFETPLFYPRALYGFGVFLSILCIYTVSDFKIIASITVLAFNWCLLVFAFSYGNALADQARYAEFRIGILLYDINALYPGRNDAKLAYQLKNTIDYAPSIKNIAKHYPVIERLVPKRLGFTGNDWEFRYFQDHFNSQMEYDYSIDYNLLDLPVVLDSYYHTIKSDGIHCFVILKH